MFAVLRSGKAAWGDISDIYRGSPYLNLDTDVLTLKAVEITEAAAAEDYSNAGEEEDDDIMQESPLSSTAETAKAKGRLRDGLKELLDLSYLCQDKLLIEEQTNAILAMVDRMRQVIPSENGFPVHQQFAGEAKKRGTFTA